MMMQQALIDTGLSFKVRFDSGGHGGGRGWIGYNLNDMEYFVTVGYNEPEKLTFETYKRLVEQGKFDRKSGYLLSERRKPLKWCIDLDLASPKLDFLNQPKAKQIDLIRDFLVNSWKIAQSISEPWT
jgi:hypothetical protein